MSDPQLNPDIHTSARAYERVAAAYEQGRPSYPHAVLERIVERSRVAHGSQVLDLAAGTGKWTRQLVVTGADIHAVEPVEAFREHLRELPITVHPGTAEAIPLEDGAMDLVTVASAFHWFDAHRALPEIARVLRPGGTVAILWNERDQRDPTQRALTELLEPKRRDEPRQSDEEWRASFETTTCFTPLEQEDFLHLHRFTADGLLERVNSISFIAALPAAERDELLVKVRALTFDKPASFDLPHITHLYLTVRRERSPN